MEIQILDPAEEDNIVHGDKSQDKGGELSRESLHLPVGHLEKEVDAGHPLDEEIRVQEGISPFSPFIRSR